MDNKMRTAVAIGAIAIITILVYASFVLKKIDTESHPVLQEESRKHPDKLKSFSTPGEFAAKMEELGKNNESRGWLMSDSAAPTGMSMSKNMASQEPTPTSPSASGDFSKTNVQVEGVDEADVVKTDGQYIYSINGGYIAITKAYPAEEANIVSRIALDRSYPEEFMIDTDRLIVFGRRNYEIPVPHAEESQPKKMSSPYQPEIYPAFQNVTFIDTYDTSDKSNPKLIKRIEFDGEYKTSRKIGDNVYVVFNNYPRFYPMYTEDKQNQPNPTAEEKCLNLVPQYREGVDVKSDTPTKPFVDCTHIHYIDPVFSSNYAVVVGMDIQHPDKEISKEVILGAGDNVYASENNIYLAGTQYNYERNILPLPNSPKEEDTEKTIINKFSLSDGKINFVNNGSVPGTVLNQFSMDEFDGNLRVATTAGHLSRDVNNTTSNNVYILDKDLDKIGTLEDIAPGEKIYSARFMGKRAFLVTFKKVDPFFTLDLSDPKNPQIIGKLKIPGYSDYLHPYDENHIIGIGKNTVEASETLAGTANFAWYQGIKMAMFDVSDFSNPKEMFKIEIGDRGTDSPILNDHEALLFSKEKNLLVIPVLEAKLTDEQRNMNKEGNEYGEYIYQGAYVFNMSLDSGFNLRGRITHFKDDQAFKKSGYYFGSQDLSVKRSLFIGDNLYTLSNGKLMSNRLDDLSLIKELEFPLPDNKERNPYYPL